MGVQPEDKRSDEYERFRSVAQRFFDAQLERIGLGEALIQSQDITELEDGLARVDDCIAVAGIFRSPQAELLGECGGVYREVGRRVTH